MTLISFVSYSLPKSSKLHTQMKNWIQDRLFFFKLPSIFLIITLFWLILHLNLNQRFQFPTGSDQDTYLEAGKEVVEHGRFIWRAPFYGAWMGLFYFVSGKTLQICFNIEKYFSVLLLGLLVAFLGFRLFDLRTGLLMGIWILNCKYFIIEANGTHAFVGSLFTMSMISLMLENQYARLPLALLSLFMAAQVRIDMWIPFLTFVIITGFFLLKRRIAGRAVNWAFATQSRPHWLICFTIGVVVSVLFTLRPWSIEPQIRSEAFFNNFAVNYVERKNLLDRYPRPWAEVPQILKEALPGTSDTISVIRMYPGEVEAHFLYNLKLFPRALIANFLAFDNSLLMLLVFIFYFGSYIVWKRPDDYLEKWKDISIEVRLQIAASFIAICWIIPMTLAFRVASRYYIPLLPLQLVVTLLMTRVLVNRLGHQN